MAQLETTDVLVASAAIAIGQPLTAQNLSWQPWPAASAGAFIKKSAHPDGIQEFTGARARTSFAAGEAIQEARVVKSGSGFLAAILPKDMRAVATEISPENSAGGFILPGDHVDVILTRAQDKNGDAYVSDTILWNAQVLAIDHNIDDKSGQSTAAGKIAMLELTSRQAEMLALARRLGTISLALRSLDAPDGQAQDGRDPDKIAGINIVRYGLSTMTQRCFRLDMGDCMFDGAERH